MNFAKCRKRAGYTQETAAAALSVATVTYGNWERGTNSPSLAQAMEVADLFDCSLDELTGRSAPNDPEIDAIASAYMSCNQTGKTMMSAYAKFATEHFPS